MKTKKPSVSIIIPLHVITKRFFTDLTYFTKLSDIAYELLIVTDIFPRNKKILNGRIIITGKNNTGPAEKRDIGIKFAKGIYCAFIDDDAYPHSQWLSRAVKEFLDNSTVVAVGGPGITPPEDDYWAQLGGLVYETVLTSGKAQHRFISHNQKRQFVTDWPAYNLIVRRDVLNKVNGYDCTFYGGEDTFLCLKLIKLGKILYQPDAIVYHHRRRLFRPHLLQIYNVGVHRGYFFKKFPETSRKLFYLIPSLLTISLIITVICFFLMPSYRLMITMLLIIPFAMGYLSVYKKTTSVGAIFVSIGIIVTHIAYGIGFIRGFFRLELQR